MDRENLENHPPLVCWFCERPTSVSEVIRQGIIRSREPRRGGPYLIFTCAFCLKDSMCEETPKGHWFASPNVKLGLIDYLFPGKDNSGGSTLDSAVILKAISWLRENEERRRYFFERDGDFRYRGKPLLKRLWPWAKEEAEPKTKKADSRHSRGREDSFRRRQSSAGRATEEKARRDRTTVKKPRILTPHEILGVGSDATIEEIKGQFYRLAVQYHPDKVHHLGSEFQEEAHKQFIRLQKAYETLTKKEKR